MGTMLKEFEHLSARIERLEAENGRLRAELDEARKESAYLAEKLGYAHDGYLDKQKECDEFFGLFREARPILECLADMHRIYELAFDDYLKSCADDGHIHDCLTHGHIRKAAEILERIGT